jgi:hypothetical protein
MVQLAASAKRFWPSPPAFGKLFGVGEKYVEQARVIVEYAPNLAEQMRAVSATGHRPGKGTLTPLAERNDRDIRRPRNQLQRLAAQQPTNQRQLALNGKTLGAIPPVIILHGNPG